MHYLDQATKGSFISSYHIEAKIAYWHCIKEDSLEKWQRILHLYDQLIHINYSPSVALNRTFALYKVKGPEEAIAEAEKLQLDHNHFYFILLAESELEICEIVWLVASGHLYNITNIGLNIHSDLLCDISKRK